MKKENSMKTTLLDQKFISKIIESTLVEDDFYKNYNYIKNLPEDKVQCQLKLKDDLIVAGLPYFFEVFNYFLQTPIDYHEFLSYEGKRIKKSDKTEVNFELPFNIVLTGERLALNMLQMASSVATYTNKFAEKVAPLGIKILDTRKTTPGLRSLEKYGVQVGGGYNHRFGQMDAWMIKDNHKSFFGGLKEAVDYFKNLHSFYTPLIVEIHDLKELKEGIKLGLNHVMLDNFSPDQVKEAIEIKPEGMSYEVSGGIRLENIEGYLIKGIDAFSVGAITYDAPHVDISLKYHR